MKKSYKKILFFELLILFICFLNSFVSNILSTYYMIAFLVVLVLLFYKTLGFEKDNHRYIKDNILDIFIFLLVYFLLYYLLGIFVGFARTENYYTLRAITNFIIPTILFIVLKEILRYGMITKIGNDKILLIFSFFVFVFLDVTNTIYYGNFSNHYDSFLFVALYLLPAISTNILCTYLSMKSGYKPVIFYLLIFNLYPYFVPIVPNPSEYIISVIQFIFPLILFHHIYQFYKKENIKKIELYHKKNMIPLVVFSLATLVLVYFTSGYFQYRSVAIASGSMSPNINKGDIVIIEKIGDDLSQLKQGDVIAYQYNNVIVVHRLIKILKENNHYYFYTKGDFNLDIDNYVIEEDMIIGVVKLKIPYIGYPTIWLNEL